MKIAKNMEAIFIVAVVFGLATSFALARTPAEHGNSAQLVADANIATVTITAKRLTAAEKRS